MPQLKWFEPGKSDKNEVNKNEASLDPESRKWGPTSQIVVVLVAIIKHFNIRKSLKQTFSITTKFFDSYFPLAIYKISEVAAFLRDRL